MRYLAPIVLTATPALSHEGAHVHVHPHGGEVWALGLLALAAGALFLRGRL